METGLLIQSLNVEICSLDGKLQDNQVIELNGNIEERINMTKLKPNIYMIKIISADNLLNYKLLKIK